MRETSLYSTETSKQLQDFLRDLKQAAGKRGFMIHNEDKMEMAHTFGKHGIEVAEDFDLHMIQICKPEKAAPSLSANPERAALMPKFITTFSKNDMLQIRLLIYGQDLVQELTGDSDFAQSLSASYQSIVEIIEEAKN
ncbi:MAG: DUF302 domain-containing protein [Desulfohalobiaceae bacterium]